MEMHSKTPTLVVFDPRGLSARTVDYWRNDELCPVKPRNQRTVHDAAGRGVEQWDPRLWALQMTDPLACANVLSVYSLSGQVLRSDSVDSGWRVSLLGAGEQRLEQWDGRGNRRQIRYDDQLRPVEIIENGASIEQLAYGGETTRDCNQHGRLVRHDDAAGVLLFNDYGLTGAVLVHERCISGESVPGYITRTQVTPLGDMQSRTDALANVQRCSHTLDGRLRAVDLCLSGTAQWLPMVSAITYNAAGQVEEEVAGNGVVTTLKHDAEDGLLRRLCSRVGQQTPLQDLRYAYDPLGNVLSIEDAALPIRYFANQRIEPICRFAYDSLSQLIEATGWEASPVRHGPLSESDGLTNYCQAYRYDEGNNLLELTHVGSQHPGHRLVAEAHSNRCLPVRDGVEPGKEAFRNGFDANGNLLMRQPGQSFSWNRQNQLCEVRPVERDAEPDDTERYFYGADGMRVRKIRSLQTNAKTNVIETLYLPGLEIRTHSGTGEELHVIDVEDGRGSVRLLHWATRKPREIANNQRRHGLTDHLGSSTLELDQDANIISQESYYPFGGTAWSNGEALQLSYKTVRYSGKERDASGLYYYGLRYYLPEWQRWLNPDPAGDADGLNVYRMVRNQPMRFRDQQGLAPVPVEAIESGKAKATEDEVPAVKVPIMYKVDYLQERLSLADAASNGAAKRVEESFTHKVNPYIRSVYTTPKASQLERPSKFFNIYSRSEWEFKDNYKYSDSGKVFLNDISRHQIRLAADLSVLPATIRRSKVRNEVTLNMTEGLESGSAELLEVFSRTPNGKPTQRLAEEVGLKMTSVTKEVTGSNVDFVVTVVPTGSYEAVFSEEVAAPVRRFSRMRPTKVMEKTT